MIHIVRLMPAALIVAALAMPGTSARADGGGQAVAASGWWDSVRAGTADAFGYGALMARSVADWVIGGGSGAGDARTEDIRGLLNLSDKEFREFDTLSRAAGYVLQGYSFGLDGGSDVELVFDFERVISEQERGDLQRQMEQQGGVASAVRRNVILGLFDATRYIDALPAGGFRLAGVTMRLGSPPDLRVRFRRVKP